jgi:hypothetical protein
MVIGTSWSILTLLQCFSILVLRILFITQSFVEHHGIHTSTLKRGMLVSSPGGQLRSHIFYPRVSLVIRGVEFSANLMVLDTRGIDVILGMETLVRWGVKIDCAQRTVHLSAPDG